MGRLSGRTAIITGAARGIGAATASLFAREGATVIVLDLAHEAAQATAERITLESARRQTGGTAVAFECDVTQESAVTDVFDRTAQIHGGIDILVNNAGITRDDLTFKMSTEQWTSVLTANLTSAFLCSQAAQRHMVPKRYGKIVNLSSRSALGNRGQANYSAAKAGIQGLTATLAIELGPFNITVNAVAPGFIATPMTDATAARVGHPVEEYHKEISARTPLRRVGEPEEVAAAILFFSSDESSYVSGQTLYINGGAR